MSYCKVALALAWLIKLPLTAHQHKLGRWLRAEWIITNNSVWKQCWQSESPGWRINNHRAVIQNHIPSHCCLHAAWWNACFGGTVPTPPQPPTQSHTKYHQRPFVPNSGVDGVVKGAGDDSHLKVESKQDTLDTHQKYRDIKTVFSIRQNVDFIKCFHWFYH